MASIEELKQRIDLHDLAAKLGLERPGGGSGNYRSPHHADKTPSLSIFRGKAGQAWKDHSGDAGGDAVALVQYVENIPDVPGAMKRLHELYGIPFSKPNGDARPAERNPLDYVARQCRTVTAPALEYLVGRGVPEATVRWAIERGAVGYNTWTNPKRQPGEIGYGGPAVAFLVRDVRSGGVLGIDYRYLDPELNGGLKTKSQGQKEAAPWTVDAGHLLRAHTWYVVESAINALCVDACGFPGAAALAIRGTGTAAGIDWRLARGKRVVLALDADQPNDKGERPGAKAAWQIYDLLTAQDVACLMVDQKSWYVDGINDVADIAKEKGIEDLKRRLRELEPWAIPGMPGHDAPPGKARVFLPPHDFATYWRFRVKEDFTSYVSKVDKTEEGVEQPKFEDLCGFRIASISRVTIQSATATMSGEKDIQPNVVFALSVQTPRHGAKLVRTVVPDERVHNVEHWKKLGPVFAPAKFLRLVNILERSADCGAREAVNFVGLAWREGRPVVNEGPDCYFSEPEKQCPYHNLVFPSGSPEDARQVIGAYQATFSHNAAALLLTWVLGAHLKAYLGFWPHMVVQADKGAGKSTLIKRLERSTGMTMFGGQSLQTEFRLVTSTSHTSHPVGWEELSARRQDTIDKAVAILQECYQYTVTRRGSEMTEYLQCAPVLLAGEDVPVKSLAGKVVRTELTGRKGTPIPDGLPRFPVRQWLEWLCDLPRERVLALHAEGKDYAWRGCRASRGDDGAVRMVENYGAVFAAWRLLTEFAGLPVEHGDFLRDVRADMNAHIKDSACDREPWVWILELLVSEIESGQFGHPYALRLVEEEPCLVLRPQHVMDHIATSHRLRGQWDGLPVKTGRVFLRQLHNHGIVFKEDLDLRINKRRHAHLTALSLPKMAEYGLFLSLADDELGATE